MPDAPTTLNDTQQIPFIARAVDEHGHPATLTGIPEWSSSDERILKITSVSPDGLRAIAAAQGNVGTCQIKAVIRSGGQTFTGVANCEVVASGATSIEIEAGTPGPIGAHPDNTLPNEIPVTGEPPVVNPLSAQQQRRR